MVQCYAAGLFRGTGLSEWISLRRRLKERGTDAAETDRGCGLLLERRGTSSNDCWGDPFNWWCWLNKQSRSAEVHPLQCPRSSEAGLAGSDPPRPAVDPPHPIPLCKSLPTIDAPPSTTRLRAVRTCAIPTRLALDSTRTLDYANGTRNGRTIPLGRPAEGGRHQSARPQGHHRQRSDGESHLAQQGKRRAAPLARGRAALV